MAHSLSAKKRIRQSLKRRARNRYRKSQIREEVKVFTTAVASGDVAASETAMKKAASRLDKVAAKGTIHKNTASRKRSRLARRLNALKASKASGAGTGAATA